MKNDIKFQEYFKSLENLKLSDSSRARIKNNLVEYARYNAVTTSEQVVRDGSDDRFIERVSHSTFISNILALNKKSMAAAIIVLMLLVGGGTSLAAEGALPGDFLYPIKVELNENIKSAFAISADAEAELQADLLAKRVSEAESLQAQGSLDSELSLAIAAQVKAQISEAEEAFAKSNETVAVASRSQAQVSVDQFNTLFSGDSTLLVNMNNGITTSAIVASDLQMAPIDTNYIISSTELRINSLVRTIAEAKANIQASVRSDLSVKLESATKLLVTARAQSDTEAQETAFKASELVGEVEAKMSLLGSVAIDPDTGAIIGIDFSSTANGGSGIDCTVIPSTMGPESLAWTAACAGDVDQSDGGISPNNINSEVDVNVDTSNSGSASGGLNGSVESSINLGL